MSQQTEQLTASRRTETGKRRMRRMRQGGNIPAILYGHGKETVAISVSADQFNAVLRHSARLVEFAGDLQENALISEVQWDTFGVEPLHIDFVRVSQSEKVNVAVSLELRGAAPGTHDGGVVSQPLHALDINCPAMAIPENIEVNINHLELDGVILASDLGLPEGAELLTPGDQVVAQCVPQVEEEEEEAAAADGAEPEVIGRKEGEEEGGDGS